jgi:hypothetical protein
MPKPVAPEARANSSLSQAGQRSRFVTARYLMHQQLIQECRAENNRVI